MRDLTEDMDRFVGQMQRAAGEGVMWSPPIEVIEQTAAPFNDGVLEITVPITEVKAKRQEVVIQEGPKPKAA